MNSKYLFITTIIFSFLLSSCATFFSPKYQKIEIKKYEKATILVDGKEPEMKEGKYLILKDDLPKSIILKQENGNEKVFCIKQYKVSRLTILDFILGGPFASVID